MSSSRIIAAFAVGALLATAMDGSASAQTAGQIFAFHSQPVGDCPELDSYSWSARTASCWAWLRGMT